MNENVNFYETEQSTEAITQLPSAPLSYVEKIELEYVEQPLKRTPEEAAAKMYELSRWYPALYYVYKNVNDTVHILQEIAVSGGIELTYYLNMK